MIQPGGDNVSLGGDGGEEVCSSTEEEQGYTPLMLACWKGISEEVEQLLRTGADVTLSNSFSQTALHLSPPELRQKVLGWMSRPHLPPQMQLLQAAWQGDLHALQHLLAETDNVDVNTPNSDGATSLMLAVRDIDLFEGMTRLPWEHRPVEVLRELLRLSPDLWVQDHSGCSALHHAANITSPLKVEIIHMMVEATDAAPVSPLALEKYSSGQHLDSELGDLDLELDLETVYTDQSTAVSPSQTPSHHQHCLLFSRSGEPLDSPGLCHQPDHHKGNSQDKRIPPCVQNAMETVTDMRQAYQDAGTGSRQRRPSVLAASPSSSSSSSSPSSALMSVATPSKLSQSAPSIMEPLLCSNTVIQARAHIQTRQHRSAPPRTPKLLAPLDCRMKDIAAPPVLKHCVPLKPISRSPLLRTRLRRETPLWCSPRIGALTTKGGSEESGSSSGSQSSIDLEDEDGEDERDMELKITEDSSDSALPHKKAIDYPHSRKVNADKVNNNRAQQHQIVREPKSNRQLKSPGVARNQRSKSAVDFITYKDMFKQIQSEDEGPAIYEMFAGTVYDNLRVPCSCEDRQVQSAPMRQIQQTFKVKHRPSKQVQSKLRRSPPEIMVISAKSKAKPVSSRVKTRLSHAKKGTRQNIPKLEAELTKEGDICHNRAQEKVESPALSTIVEDLSRNGSETLKPNGKTPQAIYGRINMQETTEDIKSQRGNRAVPESVLPQSPQQLQTDTWTPSRGSSYTVMSPIYQKFLDEVGDGPLTDDLLQCLAEELISLDERDVSLGPCSENQELSTKESRKDKPGLADKNPEVTSIDSVALRGSGLAETITWTKGEVLGRGAYGTVYCGLTSQGRLIAVKQVNLDASDPDAAKQEYGRLQGEVELLKALRHTNIVGFLGTSLCQHVVSIFMEYVPGGSIASILHRFGPLPERVLALYTHQILEGVAYLHLNRVIHRDLKGNNVLLMPTGVIKLIDFGCARRLSFLNHTASNSVDLLKSVHGTPYWMAPEVINETGYGRKSDIWSVGCTVFEMATGKPPLAHMDKMAALFYIGAKRGLMPPLPDGFSDSAKDFVKICLTNDQRLRPTADQLLEHTFIPKNETGVNSWETRKTTCCSRDGQCGQEKLRY
ncbi:uncharacterized protein map3k19 [Aulostomus maculatus]